MKRLMYLRFPGRFLASIPEGQERQESNKAVIRLAKKYDLDVRVMDAYPAYEPVDTGSDAFRLMDNSFVRH